jgi:hypothetical protein
LNVLFSYYYCRNTPYFIDLIEALSPYCRVMIDSGAYSNYYSGREAIKQGKTFNGVTLPEYMQLLHDRFHGKVWQYIMLDVVRDPVASERNWLTMLDAGLVPMPVVVYKQPLDNMAELAAINPHICVAGGVETTIQWSASRYQAVYKASGGVAKIHGLGFVKHPAIYQLPLYSIDSSSWCSGGQYGIITRFDPKKGLYGVGWDKMPKRPDIVDYLTRTCNVPVAWLNERKYYRRHIGVPGMVTVYANLEQHRFAATKQRKIFLAVVNYAWMQELTAAVQACGDRTFDYPKAREFNEYLRSMTKPQQTDAIVKAIKESTAWQEEEEVQRAMA